MSFDASLVSWMAAECERHLGDYNNVVALKLDPLTFEQAVSRLMVEHGARVNKRVQREIRRETT